MKEAIGNTFLINLAIVLMGIVMILLVASLVYSKTYKVKNRIINTMEKYDDYSLTTEELSGESKVKLEIYSELSKIGYPISTRSESCPTKANAEMLHNNAIGAYDFCLYKILTQRGFYFHVIVYTHYEIPIIGQYLRFPIEGDTRTFYEEVGG